MLKSTLLFASFLLALDASACETAVVELEVGEDDSATVTTHIIDGATGYARSVTTAPQQGSLSGFKGPGITYYTGANFNGTDRFELRVDVTFEDAPKQECHTQVNVTVTPRNDPPVASPFTTRVARGTRTRLEPVASDPVERSPVLIRPITMPEHGAVVDSLGQPVDYSAEGLAVLFYEPDSGFEGRDTFQLQAWDGEHYSELVTATLLVGPSLAIRRGAKIPPTEPPPTWIHVRDAAGRARLVRTKAVAGGIVPDASSLPSGTWIYGLPSDPAVQRRIVVP